MAKNKKKKSSGVAERKKAAMETIKFVSMIEADKRRAFDQGMMYAAVIVLWMMHREYGFGKKRLIRILNQISQYSTEYIAPAYSNDIAEGEFAGLSAEDMCQALEEECEIYIDLKKGRVYSCKEDMEVDV